MNELTSEEQIASSRDDQHQSKDFRHSEKVLDERGKTHRHTIDSSQKN